MPIQAFFNDELSLEKQEIPSASGIRAELQICNNVLEDCPAWSTENSNKILTINYVSDPLRAL